MTDRESSALWKSVSSTLTAVLLTGVTAWFTFGAENVSRNELKDSLGALSAKHEREMNDLRQQLRESAKAQHDAAVEMARLSQKLSDFIASKER